MEVYVKQLMGNVFMIVERSCWKVTMASCCFEANKWQSRIYTNIHCQTGKYNV